MKLHYKFNFNFILILLVDFCEGKFKIMSSQYHINECTNISLALNLNTLLKCYKSTYT
jgi:hypothetical protein